MKVKVFPVHKKAGKPCYTFVDSNLRKAYKALTGFSAASKTKLTALSAFGVDVVYEEDDTSPLLP